MLLAASIVIGLFVTLHAQQKQLTGTITVRGSNQAIPFANVALYDTTDSTMISGTTSNFDGKFDISPVAVGSYSLRISVIGYEPMTKLIEVSDTSDNNTGIICLQKKVVRLEEVEVVGERIKAKSETDKTTFFINKKMLDASNTGVDILTYIPGVQVDIMHNISLEGSRNIMILVDGKERDRNFLSQLRANQIDKIEIINSPNSEYDANVTGVIDVILKKNRDSGMSGHVYIEIPTSKSEIYIFPTYSLNFSFKKFNIYTSYNGELSYFDIIESSYRKLWNSSGTTEIISNQYVKQKNWSHRFHFGADYFLNKKNQFNFYAYYNPYSREHDGNIEMKVVNPNGGNEYWLSQKEDTDINYSAFYSLYYKHVFNKPGREITFDLSYYDFKAENTTSYTDENAGSNLTNHTNTVKPKQNSASIRIDYASPITERLKFKMGVKTRLQKLQDRNSDEFNYNENIFAIYGTLNYSVAKFEMGLGLRAERSVSGLTCSFNNNIFTLLPYAVINYKPDTKQNIKLTYRNSIYRPNIYQLNPYPSIEDPFTVKKGNPNLEPEFHHDLMIDYSIRLGNNYISSRLFYSSTTNAINNLTFINDTNVFETRVYNLGEILRYGIQLSGSLKPYKSIALNPYIKVFNISTRGNKLAAQYNIGNRNKIAIESGLSAIISFRHNFTASILFQYNGHETDIQGMSFSGALYFISLEKTINQKFKVGIVSAIPFSKSFTYQGNEIEAKDFYSHSEGKIIMSAFPIWFKFKYQFSSGKKGNRINRTKEKIQNMPKKGF